MVDSMHEDDMSTSFNELFDTEALGDSEIDLLLSMFPPSVQSSTPEAMGWTSDTPPPADQSDHGATHVHVQDGSSMANTGDESSALDSLPCSTSGAAPSMTHASFQGRPRPDEPNIAIGGNLTYPDIAQSRTTQTSAPSITTSTSAPESSSTNLDSTATNPRNNPEQQTPTLTRRGDCNICEKRYPLRNERNENGVCASCRKKLAKSSTHNTSTPSMPSVNVATARMLLPTDMLSVAQNTRWDTAITDAAAARAHLHVSPWYPVCVQGDDVFQLDAQAVRDFAERLFGAVLEAPLEAPAHLDDEQKSRHRSGQLNAFKKCKKLLRTNEVDSDTSARCMEVVDETRTLHTHGIRRNELNLVSLDSVDVHNKKKPSKRVPPKPFTRSGFQLDVSITCTERLELIIKAVSEDKNVALAMVLGQKMKDIVRCPSNFLMRTRANRKANDDKSKSLKLAAQLKEKESGDMHGTQSQTSAGAKRKADDHVDDDDNDDDDGIAWAGQRTKKTKTANDSPAAKMQLHNPGFLTDEEWLQIFSSGNGEASNDKLHEQLWTSPLEMDGREYGSGDGITDETGNVFGQTGLAAYDDMANSTNGSQMDGQAASGDNTYASVSVPNGANITIMSRTNNTQAVPDYNSEAHEYHADFTSTGHINSAASALGHADAPGAVQSQAWSPKHY